MREPVRHRGELLGALSIVKKPGESITATEEKLGRDLAAQAGPVMRNVALADTLVLRSGRSYRGELISVRDGRVEFRVDRGRTERFTLADVDRIEFSGREGEDSRDDQESRPPGGERPSGLREREVDVPGAQAWTRTSIELRDGQEIWLDSRGEVRWGPGRKDGPGGESGSPRNQGRPIPSRAGASLIGKIGETPRLTGYRGRSWGLMLGADGKVYTAKGEGDNEQMREWVERLTVNGPPVELTANSYAYKIPRKDQRFPRLAGVTNEGVV